MNLVTLVVILTILFIFCGGGFVIGATPLYYGSGLGAILLVLLILWLAGRE